MRRVHCVRTRTLRKQVQRAGPRWELGAAGLGGLAVGAHGAAPGPHGRPGRRALRQQLRERPVVAQHLDRQLHRPLRTALPVREDLTLAWSGGSSRGPDVWWISMSQALDTVVASSLILLPDMHLNKQLRLLVYPRVLRAGQGGHHDGDAGEHAQRLGQGHLDHRVRMSALQCTTMQCVPPPRV